MFAQSFSPPVVGPGVDRCGRSSARGWKGGCGVDPGNKSTRFEICQSATDVDNWTTFETPQNPRLLRDAVDDLAEAFAHNAVHEIGHSFGLVTVDLRGAPAARSHPTLVLDTDVEHPDPFDLETRGFRIPERSTMFSGNAFFVKPRQWRASGLREPASSGSASACELSPVRIPSELGTMNEQYARRVNPHK